MDCMAILFITSNKTPLKASTKCSYAKNLRALLRILGHQDTPNLDMFIKAQSAVAAGQPLKQAPPTTPVLMNRMVERAWAEDPTGRLPMCIWLAHKTASRWGDLASLTKGDLILRAPNLEEDEIIIQWGNKTKTSRFRQFRVTGLTVVKEIHHHQTIPYFTNNTLRRMKSKERICPKSTAQMDAWLKKDPQTAHLTCHSFKRGSLNQLAELALEGKFEPRLIPILAKHQDPLHQFPESTIRYINNKVALAKMFQTQLLTQHL